MILTQVILDNVRFVFDVFWFILTHILLVLPLPGSAETVVGWGKKIERPFDV